LINTHSSATVNLDQSGANRLIMVLIIVYRFHTKSHAIDLH